MASYRYPAKGGGGGGDVAGPASATDDNIATFNGTTGKLIQDSGVAIGAIAAAQADATQALSDASDAQTDATQALSDASAAQADADQALLDAAAAQGDATQALSDASAAQTDATQALSDASAAQADADQALLDAAAAQADADQALLDAAAAQATADSKQAAGNYITALTGEVTASGPGSVAATVTNSAVIGKVITGYVSGAGAVAATDTILQAIQKLNGNTAAVLAPTSVAAVNTNVTLTNKRIHLVDTSAARSLTLPSPSADSYIVVKDAIGSAQTNNITIVRAGSEEIETVAASFVLNTNLGSWTFVSDGTDWFIV